MKKQLIFEANNEGQRIFAAVWLALRFGRNLIREAPGKAVLRQERNIFRALEAASERDPEKTDDLRCQQCNHLVMAREMKARVLRPDGATVILEQADVDLLIDRIDTGAWTGDAAADMGDALDFLSNTKEHA